MDEHIDLPIIEIQASRDRPAAASVSARVRGWARPHLHRQAYTPLGGASQCGPASPTVTQIYYYYYYTMGLARATVRL